MANKSPIMGLEQIAEFKDFLNANITSVAAITLLVFGLLIVMSFGLREVVSWLAKTDSLKKELRALRTEVAALKAEIQDQSFLMDSNLPSKEESKTAFPLNH